MRMRVWLVIVAVAALLSPVAWFLGSPLFTTRGADETLPSTPAPAEQISR